VSASLTVPWYLIELGGRKLHLELHPSMDHGTAEPGWNFSFPRGSKVLVLVVPPQPCSAERYERYDWSVGRSVGRYSASVRQWVATY